MTFTAPQSDPLAALDPELRPIVQRESGGKQFVGYTPPGRPLVDLSTAQLDETGFPIWSGNRDPKTGLMSHAAGIGQFQPGTWRPIAKELGVKDFSLESQVKVANELRRREGLRPWAASAGGYGHDPVVAADDWKVDPSAITEAQEQKGTRVVWMGPDEYKQMVQKGEEPEERPASKSLARSLAKGDAISSLPEMTVKMQDGKYVVTDQDGWRRADVAEKAGVQLIPVAIKGATADASEIVGVGGQSRPFDFKSVPAAPSRTNAEDAKRLREKYGVIGGAAAAIGKDIGDLVGGAVRGFGEGAAEGGRDIAGVGPSRPGENVSRSVVGAEAAFASPFRVTPAAPLAAPAEAPFEMVGGRPSPAPPPFGGQPVSTNALRDLALQNEARGIVSQRVGEGVVPPVELERQLGAGRQLGQPLTLPDIAGKPVADLQGQIYRQGGPAAAKIEKFYQERDATAGPRAESAIAKNLGTGTLKQTQDDLIRERSRAARPLWDKAMAGGSVAPLEQQFERVFGETSKALSQAEKGVSDAQNRITQAAARQSTGGNVYADSGANRSRTFAQDQLRDAEATRIGASKVRDEALSRLRAAQADGTANAPGAVWSPRLQQFLENPRVQQGLRRGQRIERDTALAENRPMNLAEYAVVGTKPNGDWVVGAVPTMRLLAVAKEGLDALLESDTLKNPLTGRLNKEGVAVDKVRREFVSELDQLNPAYKPARDAWSGHTSSISALQFGRDMLNKGRGHYAEDVVQRISEMTPNEKEFAKVGLAATYRERLRNVADAGDESKALANTAGTRMRIQPLFPSEEAASRFLNFVDNERAMFDTGQRMTRGSTASDLAADRMPMREAAMFLEGGQAISHLASGNVLAALRSGLRLGRAAMSDRPTVNPRLNEHIADLLTDPNVGLHVADPRGVLPPLQRPPGGPNMLGTMMSRLPSVANALRITPPTQLGSPHGLPVRLPPGQP